MEYRVGRMLEVLHRLDGMISDCPELASLDGTSARDALRATIAEIDAHIVHQDAGARSSRGETARQRAVVKALRVQLRGLCAAAKLTLRESPALSQFTLPRSNLPLEPLIQAAHGMAEAAKPFEATLVAGGLLPGFIERLTTGADEVRATLTDRAAEQGRRNAATATLNGLAGQTARIITMLEAAVLPLIVTDPGLLAQWNSAKRIGRKPGVPRGSAARSAPDIAPAPLVSTPEVTNQAA